jgi:hypothetical protein
MFFPCIQNRDYQAKITAEMAVRLPKNVAGGVEARNGKKYKIHDFHGLFSAEMQTFVYTVSAASALFKSILTSDQEQA